MTSHLERAKTTLLDDFKFLSTLGTMLQKIEITNLYLKKKKKEKRGYKFEFPDPTRSSWLKNEYTFYIAG